MYEGTIISEGNTSNRDGVGPTGSTLVALTESGYRVTCRSSLAPKIGEFLDLISLPPEQSSGGLGGKGQVVFGQVSGLGHVALKRYRRGGLFRLISREHYLRAGPTRCQREYELLQHVRSIGVNAPEPIAYITRGGLFYQAWVLTRAIEKKQGLDQIALEDEQRAADCMDSVVRQVRLLIEHNIFHVDLHPGNVLVDGDGIVHIIDFDKARRYSGARAVLRDRYLCRWRRANIKHNLPDVLSELFCLGLRKDFQRYSSDPTGVSSE